MAEQKYSNILVSSRADGKLAYTDNIFDKLLQKLQQTINSEFNSRLIAIENKLNISVNSNGQHIWTVGNNKYLLTPYSESATPEINVSPSVITFNGIVGQTYTNTFTVIGTNLTGPVNLVVNNNAIYSLSVSRITVNEATSGTRVTVTYSPTAIGASNAIITLSSNNAANVTISVSGTASSAATPVISVDNSNISLECYEGETDTATFTVTGENLTEDIDITGTLSSGEIGLSEYSITKENAVNGYTITVTFTPGGVGSMSRIFTLSSAGASSVSIAVNAVSHAALVPTITVDTASIKFYGSPNATDNKTVIVTGTNLVGPISVSNTSSKIIPSVTSISAENAEQGYSLIINYNAGSSAGSFIDDIVLTTEGGESVTIPVEVEAEIEERTYATPVITAISYPNISADGGTVFPSNVVFGQDVDNTWSNGNHTNSHIDGDLTNQDATFSYAITNKLSNEVTIDSSTGGVYAPASSVTSVQNVGTVTPQVTINGETSTNTSVTAIVKQNAAAVRTYFYIGQTYGSTSDFAALTTAQLQNYSTKTAMEDGTVFTGTVVTINVNNAYEHVTAINGTTTIGGTVHNNNTYFIMIPSNISLQAALLYVGGLDTPFTPEEIASADSWESQHDDVVIDGVTYSVHGYRNTSLYGNSMKLYIK